MHAHEALCEHLRWWGLRRFESDAAYFQWQRETLRPADLTALHALAEQKRSVATPSAEQAFYDLTAKPEIVPVLYSQRYDYYLAVGTTVAERIGEARAILDFGCGVGVLTTFYAAQFPDRSIIGVDRSPASIAMAQAQAGALGLKNLHFEAVDLEHRPLAGRHDLIIATHALLQAEQDPGLPSLSWQTFARGEDPGAQLAFERRTGLDVRLDALGRVLAPGGRWLIFEKTRQLSRRVAFQRALAARGLGPVEAPVPIRYRLVEEIVDDGPLYVLSRDRGSWLAWDEAPELLPGDGLYRARGAAARAVLNGLPARLSEGEQEYRTEAGPARVRRGSAGFLRYWMLTIENRFEGIVVGAEGLENLRWFGQQLDEALADNKRLEELLNLIWPASSPEQDPATTPLYENHAATAQEVWERLPARMVQQQATDQEPDGRQRHIELGTAGGMVFLYWANTFDQRQLVLVEPARAALLEEYYRESLQSGSAR